ncbi:hypothetical protein HOK00_06365, partial [bacterium]|nr:hypothetical protein [bacterium]
VIKDKYNGLLCGKNDSKAFSKNIEKLINMDQESLNEFIKNGHSEVSKYTISAQKKVLIDSLYKYRILSK